MLCIIILFLLHLTPDGELWSSPSTLILTQSDPCPRWPDQQFCRSTWTNAENVVGTSMGYKLLMRSVDDFTYSPYKTHIQRSGQFLSCFSRAVVHSIFPRWNPCLQLLLLLTLSCALTKLLGISSRSSQLFQSSHEPNECGGHVRWILAYTFQRSAWMLWNFLLQGTFFPHHHFALEVLIPAES